MILRRRAAPAVAEHVFQENPNRERQPRQGSQTLSLEFCQAENRGRAIAEPKRATRAKGVVRLRRHQRVMVRGDGAGIPVDVCHQYIPSWTTRRLVRNRSHASVFNSRPRRKGVSLRLWAKNPNYRI